MARRALASLLVAVVLCGVALIALPRSAEAAPAGYVISNYDVTIVVNDDNSYDVTETIDVEFSAQRHGIFRTIPFGSTSGFPAEVRNIRVEGGPFTTEWESTQVNVRIGDPNRFADPLMRYVLRYTFYVGDDANPDFDEFYFNIIGTEWDTSILNVTFTVVMPHPFDEGDLNITAGSYGSIANVGYLSYQVDGNTITGFTVQPLLPREGITVALTLPEGYYTDVSPRFDWTVLLAWLGLLLFPLIAALIWWLWRIWRRNETIFPSVQFYPPEGMTSADVGFIMDGASSPREITSLLFYWAGKGNIAIEESTKRQIFGSNTTYTFKRLKSLDPATSKPYEQKLFNQLFALGDGNTVTSKQLEYRFHEHITKAQQGVAAFFTDIDETRIVAKTNTRFVILAGLLTILCALLIMPIAAPFLWIYQFGLSYAFVTGSVLAGALCVLFYLFFKPYTDRVHATGATWFLSVVAGILALIVAAILLVAPFAFSEAPVFIKPLATLLGLAAVALGGWALSTPYRRTPLGDDYMGRLLGFREFLKVAEKDRIEMLLEENPSYFFDTLPFALVMGVTGIWADKFKDIEMQPPEWFTSDSGVPFAPIIFMNTMNSSLNTMSTVATSSPAQSGGSSGGGFSGGGFGGGGGGSW
ncbi:MAG: DUF2207 domain-containing protein [Actinomycetia bacterium]|nr:DUF2207 domain-containing protein [Actinomycetes bacterium]